jgi:uncharacterized protein YijF (DUF1287 family)
MKRARVWIVVSVACVALGLAIVLGDGLRAPGEPAIGPPDGSAEVRSTLPTATPEAYGLVEAAVAQVGVTRSYDPAYVALDYPGGDVPLETGVCTDVVVRAFRGVGIDLQQAVHEDMSASFSAYPRRWGLTRPDPNIDHRRVPNLQTYFARQGMGVPVTGEGRDYLPGDIVTWTVGGRPHIGIVSAEPASGDRHYLIVHNIGRGAVVEDVLFRFEITGHYRWR